MNYSKDDYELRGYIPLMTMKYGVRFDADVSPEQAIELI